MLIEIDGQTYYGTSETCKKTGISRATLFRWLKLGILEKHYKDRRGWRIFTEEDLNKIRTEAKRIEVEYASPRQRIDKNGNI
jgi:DNA-binding transcriptional MerR regulator